MGLPTTADCATGVGGQPGRSRSSAWCAPGLWRSEVGDELEQLADIVRLLHGVSERALRVDLVMVASPVACPLYVALLDQVGHDCLGSTLSDPHLGSNVPSADPGVTGDAHQDVAVVGQERPAWPRCFLRSTNRRSHLTNVAGLVKSATCSASDQVERRLAPEN